MKCSFSSPYIQQSSDAAQVIQEKTDQCVTVEPATAAVVYLVGLLTALYGVNF
jgi:hypothetical protein